MSNLFASAVKLHLGNVRVTPTVLLQTGEQVSENSIGEFAYSLATHYCARSDKFSRHVAIVLPLRGANNNNLGASVYTGSACRYVDKSKVSHLVREDELSSILKAMDYSGPVSVSLDLDHNVLHYMTGVPAWGLYGMMGTLYHATEKDYWERPSEVEFFECWSASLLVTRSPWPVKEKAELVRVGMKTEPSRKHFYPLCRMDADTDRTLLGVAVGWDATRLSRAVNYCKITAQNVLCAEKQYRTDMYETIAPLWARLMAAF